MSGVSKYRRDFTTFSLPDHKAIAWFFETNPEFKVEMTYYPQVTYTVKETGERKQIHISTLKRQWVEAVGKDKAK